MAAKGLTGFWVVQFTGGYGKHHAGTGFSFPLYSVDELFSFSGAVPPLFPDRVISNRGAGYGSLAAKGYGTKNIAVIHFVAAVDTCLL